MAVSLHLIESLLYKGKSFLIINFYFFLSRSKKRSRHHDKSNGRSHHGHRHKNNGRHQEQNGSHLENNKDQHDNSSDEPVKDEPVHDENNTNNEKDVKKTTFFLMGEEEEDHTV